MPAKISFIAAIGEHGELGSNNNLPWHLPDDFAWFVRTTKGHVVVMGRKTMESLGKPLRNRRNLVITSNKHLKADGFEVFNSIEDALSAARETETEEIFIIGGGVIFEETMHMANRIYLTRVSAEFPQADTFFPALDDSWERTFREFHPTDEKHAYPFYFEIWDRGNS